MRTIFNAPLITADMADVLSDRNVVEAMLRFEAALARAQAAQGLIPVEAAQSIIATCKVDLFDVPRIVRESAHAGSVAIPMVRLLQDTVGLFNADAVACTHLGVASQDAVDSASAMVTRQALGLIEAELGMAIEALFALAEAHRAQPILARTLTQPASVTSLGLKVVAWLAPLVRAHHRLRRTAAEALRLQLGGAVGTQAGLGGQGAAIARQMAAELGLAEPEGPWHTQRDDWVALACELGLLAGSLGKIGRDLALLGQFEVGEIREPIERGRGGSPVLPHKHNPVAAMVAITGAQRAPERVAALLASMPQEHERGLGSWQAEQAEWPQLLATVHASAQAMAHALPRLQVFPQRMQANLEAVRQAVPPEVAAQWFDPALAEAAGEQARAQLAALRVKFPAKASAAPSPAPAPQRAA